MKSLLFNTVLYLMIVSLFTTFPGVSQYPAKAESYTVHEPVIIRNVHGTAEDPYIVEGYDITSAQGNCIEVQNSEHVIIRGNYLHDCQIDREGTDFGLDLDDINANSGFAILAGNSRNITIENNQLEYNKQGILVYQTEDVTILSNDVRHTIWWRAVALEKCEGVEIAENSVIDNGIPEWFWAPGQRVLGIWTQQTSSLEIHDNTVIRPTTDGIMVLGIIYNGSMTADADDWTTTVHDIRIYNNTILDVMEIGIAITRARNVEIYNNVVRQGSIVLDPDVCDSEVFGNKVLTFKTPGAITLGISHNNYVHDNTYYSIDDAIEGINIVQNIDELSCQPTKCEWMGIPYQPSSGNTIENNQKIKIGGALKQAIVDKMAVASEEGLWEPKGRFSCETAEGVWDEDCIAREEAKGNQGIPFEWMVFEPLMDNFDAFAVVEEKPVQPKIDSLEEKPAEPVIKEVEPEADETQLSEETIEPETEKIIQEPDESIIKEPAKDLEEIPEEKNLEKIENSGSGPVDDKEESRVVVEVIVPVIIVAVILIMACGGFYLVKKRRVRNTR
ncbi:MAG: right-handed parallel beta-helix repeat-containing protein [Dehalococcoidales bacterium]|nr:right-handed parallel beta-helix repeat-containing protein [Dehalococcoidales bacterium]